MKEIFAKIDKVMLSLALVAPFEVSVAPSESETCERLKELSDLLDELRKEVGA